MPRRIQYPALTLPVGNFTPSAPAAAPQGWEVVSPSKTFRVNRPQPDRLTLPPGQFATTNTTYGGADAIHPSITRGLRRVHPDGYTLPVGQFTTTNTQQGWDVLSPSVTRGTKRVQPPGHVLPDGAFTTIVTAPSLGWPAYFPATTQGTKRIQPDGQTLPVGAFTTVTSRVSGWEVIAPITVPVVRRPNLAVTGVVGPHIRSPKQTDDFPELVIVPMLRPRGRVSVQPPGLTWPDGAFTTGFIFAGSPWNYFAQMG